MIVTLNGHSRELEPGSNVGRVLDDLQLPAIRVAVEVNRQLVSRSDYQSTMLNDGDVIEVVTLVGGG